MIWALLFSCGDDSVPRGVCRYEGDVSLSSEAEMSQFCAACDSVQGNLWIGAENTEALACLVAVTGDIDTNRTPLILPNLATVGGSIVSANGGGAELEALVSVGGNLEVGSESAILLPALTTLGGSLRIQTTYDPPVLPALAAVPGVLALHASYLTNLDAFAGVRQAGGLSLGQNGELVDLTALHGIEISGDVCIQNSNSNLSSAAVDAFVAASQISGTVEAFTTGCAL